MTSPAARPSFLAEPGVCRALLDIRDLVAGFPNPTPRTSILSTPAFHFPQLDRQLEEIILDLRDAALGARSGFRSGYVTAPAYVLVYADAQLCASLRDLRAAITASW
jgi:hypothetical protein